MTSEAIEAIAKLLDKTTLQLATDIWRLASVIERQKNKGFSLAELAKFGERDDLKTETYFLNGALYEDAYRGILFYAQGNGRRKWERAEGWMVRKDPHWKTVWLALYGDTNAPCAADYRREESERLARLAAAPKRPNDDSPGAKFESLTTLQVGHRMAVADIMCQQGARRWLDRMGDKPLPDPNEPKPKRRTISDDRLDSMDVYAAEVWSAQKILMLAELRYRAETGDELAHDILKAGSAYFYTNKTAQAWIDSEIVPRWINGYLGQPYDIEQPPIDRINDSQIQRQFVVRILNSIEP